MVRQPVQCSIGVDQIILLRRVPRTQILMQPFDVGRSLASGSHHFSRAFNADDSSVRPSIFDQSGDVAGAGAKIGNPADLKIRNAHQKIDGGPQSMSGKFQILLRIPYHRPSPFWFFMNSRRSTTLADAQVSHIILTCVHVVNRRKAFDHGPRSQVQDRRRERGQHGNRPRHRQGARAGRRARGRRRAAERSA